MMPSPSLRGESGCRKREEVGGAREVFAFFGGSLGRSVSSAALYLTILVRQS